jgi:hypothetical protein
MGVVQLPIYTHVSNNTIIVNKMVQLWNSAFYKLMPLLRKK